VDTVYNKTVFQHEPAAPSMSLEQESRRRDHEMIVRQIGTVEMLNQIYCRITDHPDVDLDLWFGS
jgi:hypothetical protein